MAARDAIATSRDDLSALDAYLAQIRDLPVLTREQEVELGEAIRRHAEAFRSGLARLRFTAGRAVARWRDIRARGLSTAPLSESWREPGAPDPGPMLDDALGRLAALLERGARREILTPAGAEHLARANLAMAVLEEIWSELETAPAPRGAAARELVDAVRDSHRALVEVRNRFVRHNLKFVLHMVKPYRSLGIPLMDLIQEGNLGLIRAVEKFDARRGFKFSTYAGWWVQQSFVRAAQHQSRTVRLPGHVYELAIRESRARDRLWGELGRAPSDAELSQALAVPLDQIEWLHRANRPLASIDASLDPQAPDGSGGTLGDRLRDRAVEDPADRIDRSRLASGLAELLSSLEPRERLVVSLRFGLADEEALTLREAGAQLGLSRERVRQIEAAALEKLRLRARRSGLEDPKPASSPSPSTGWPSGSPS